MNEPRTRIIPSNLLNIPAEIADKLPAGYPIKQAMDIAYGAMGYNHQTHLWSDAVYADLDLGYFFRRCTLPKCLDRQVVTDAVQRADHESGVLADYVYADPDPYGVEAARRFHAAVGIPYDPDTIPTTDEGWNA